MFDWDQFGKADFLGKAAIDFSDFKDDEKRDLWLPLLDENNQPTNAQLRCEIHWNIH